MMRPNLPSLLSALICVGMALRVGLVWDRLPEVMASHFGADGTANGFQTKLSFALVSIGIMALMAALFVLAPRLLRLLPSRSINVPHREYWLVPERREAALDKLTYHLGFISLMMQAFTAAVYELVIQANLARQALNNVRMFVLLALLFAGVITSLVRLARDFRVPTQD